jgi:hypothetical protein
VIDDGVVLGSEFEQHGSTGYRVQGAGYRSFGYWRDLRMTRLPF